MTYKIRVEYTRSYDPHSQKIKELPELQPYTKEFNTKEELGLFILDLADKEQEEIIVGPIYKGDHPLANQDYRDIEIYNDYRE